MSDANAFIDANETKKQSNSNVVGSVGSGPTATTGSSSLHLPSSSNGQLSLENPNNGDNTGTRSSIESSNGKPIPSLFSSPWEQHILHSAASHSTCASTDTDDDPCFRIPSLDFLNQAAPSTEPTKPAVPAQRLSKDPNQPSDLASTSSHSKASLYSSSSTVVSKYEQVDDSTYSTTSHVSHASGVSNISRNSQQGKQTFLDQPNLLKTFPNKWNQKTNDPQEQDQSTFEQPRSCWSQQHSTNQPYQWPSSQGVVSKLEPLNAAVCPPPLFPQNQQSNITSSMAIKAMQTMPVMPTHFEENPPLPTPDSISSSSTSSTAQFSFNNIGNINVSSSKLNATVKHPKSNLTANASHFQPTTLAAAAAVASVPFTTSQLTAGVDSLKINATAPATHISSASGELSALRRQVQQRQQYQLQKQKEQLSRVTASCGVGGFQGGENDLFSVGDESSCYTLNTGIASSNDGDSITSSSLYNPHLNLQSANNTISSMGSHLSSQTPKERKREWLLRMNRKMNEIPLGHINSDTLPITAIMNAWAKTKSAEGAKMVEDWLQRMKEESKAGNPNVEVTTKMFTMAVDAWAKSGEKGAAMRAEAILHSLNTFYQQSGHDENLRPTTGIFNAVINAWARSGEKIAPQRAEQILSWMEKLCGRGNTFVKPDKYTFNTVIHAYAKCGGKEAAIKAQQLLQHMHRMHAEGNSSAKPDTITYNVVINCLAKSGGKGASLEAEKLLSKMHSLYDNGDPDVKPNVVTYGAVIDAWAKSGEKGAAGRADNILANMIQLHQNDPVRNADLRPNTYTFNTVINAWAKSKEPDAASKAEEMLVAMGRLHNCGIPGLKPDAFTYTAVIDAWAKSGYRGAAARADQLLDKMEAQYQSGDLDLKPNTFTYNAVINALAKSGEPGAAARAERVLHKMVKRHRTAGGSEDVKPTTINFNTVLDAWAKTGGKAAAERAEEILEWMDRLNKAGNIDVKPDTITFNAVIDAWARSGDKRAPLRAEQILDHMDDLYQGGNKDVKPDTYTYNTVINAWAKSGERGSASRAEQILSVMEGRYREGDNNLKPNTRTHTSVIDAWAKSGERGAAARAEHILNTMQALYESSKDPDIKPNAHTCNAVMNACAFTKTEGDRTEALEIAFRVFDWLSSRSDMHPDAYTFTILLSVCSNLLPNDDQESRFTYAKALFEKCCEAGYVNSFVLRKLKQTVTEEEHLFLLGYNGTRDPYSSVLPSKWTKNVKNGRNRRGRGNWK